MAHTPHTLVLALAQSAFDAVKPSVPGPLIGTAVHRLEAVDYVVTATLEEFDDLSKADLKLTLESLHVLAGGDM